MADKKCISRKMRKGKEQKRERKKEKGRGGDRKKKKRKDEREKEGTSCYGQPIRDAITKILSYSTHFFFIATHNSTKLVLL